VKICETTTSSVSEDGFGSSLIPSKNSLAGTNPIQPVIIGVIRTDNSNSGITNLVLIDLLSRGYDINGTAIWRQSIQGLPPNRQSV
jgi:hypothetical protein